MMEVQIFNFTFWQMAHLSNMSLLKGSDVPTKVGLLLACGNNFGRMPFCHHQWLIWVPTGVESKSDTL